MSRRTTAAVLTLAAGLGLATSAAAHDGVSFDFNIGVATDYVFRGVSQTDGDPQVFGGADLTAGMFYAGVWASNVDFGDGTDLEYDLYAGITPVVGVFQLNLAILYYGYVNAPSGADYNYVELQATASVPLGPAIFGAGFYYTPNSYSHVDHSFYGEVNASYSPNAKVSLSGALGRQTFAGTGDYTTWNIGVGYAINDHLGVDLRYHDTNRDRFGKVYKGRVALSLKAAF